jgi:hypothetical protein
MTPYYKGKLEAALVYQDFVIDVAQRMAGLAISQYSSREYQYGVGESRIAEIKHDERFAETRNLWIEVAEKARPRDGEYVASGLHHAGPWWLYAIGNYDTVFLFARNHLVQLEQDGRRPLIENGLKTSTGFLLAEADARWFAVLVLEPGLGHLASRLKLTCDAAAVGRELHRAVHRIVPVVNGNTVVVEVEKGKVRPPPAGVAAVRP